MYTILREYYVNIISIFISINYNSLTFGIVNFIVEGKYTFEEILFQ